MLMITSGMIVRRFWERLNVQLDFQIQGMRWLVTSCVLINAHWLHQGLSPTACLGRLNWWSTTTSQIWYTTFQVWNTTSSVWNTAFITSGIRHYRPRCVGEDLIGKLADAWVICTTDLSRWENECSTRRSENFWFFSFIRTCSMNHVTHTKSYQQCNLTTIFWNNHSYIQNILCNTNRLYIAAKDTVCWPFSTRLSLTNICSDWHQQKLLLIDCYSYPELQCKLHTVDNIGNAWLP